MDISADPALSSPARRRACDECKRRKRKCDGQSPQCSLCVVTSTDCKYTSVPRKRGPKPGRRAQPHLVNSDGEVSLDETETRNSSVSATPSLHGSIRAVDRPSDFQRTHYSLPPPPMEAEASIAIPFPNDNNSPLMVHQTLYESTKRTGTELDVVARGCIELFMHRRFPGFPIVSPPKLLNEVHLLLPSSSHLFAPNESVTSSGLDQQSLGISEMRAFCLVTSLCAFICHKGDEFALGHCADLVMPFLQASRQMLRCWEDQDIGHPDSSSLVTRILHAATFHALGKRRLSWYVIGQAQRIALGMRLYAEESFSVLDQVESQLRRNVFWVLYIADKSAWILSDVPTTFHEIGLARSLTTTLQSQMEPCLLDGSREECLWPYEAQLQEGLSKCCQIWSMGADLLLDMKILSRMNARIEAPNVDSSPFALSIMRSYMEFNVIMESLPAWLRDPDSHVASNSATTASQRLAFWIQRADLVVTYHCLRLVLLQKASQQGFCGLLGVTDNVEMLALQNIEITQDFLNAANTIPFEALLANGEPLVEKFRQAGARLLEIVNLSQSQSISNRAKLLFSSLIDIIARLNSRVSDELVRDFSSL